MCSNEQQQRFSVLRELSEEKTSGTVSVWWGVQVTTGPGRRILLKIQASGRDSGSWSVSFIPARCPIAGQIRVVEAIAGSFIIEL